MATVTRTVTEIEDFTPALERWMELPGAARAFLLHLLRNRLDDDTIGVFADWLEENGRDEAGRKVRLLRPREGDALVITLPPRATLAEHEQARALARHFPGVHSLVVRGTARVSVTATEELRQHGWVRAEEVERRVAEERELAVAVVERMARHVLAAGNPASEATGAMLLDLAAVIHGIPRAED